MAGDARVVVLVATYRRNREVARLLGALKAQTGPVAGMVVADNGADPECRAVVESAEWPTVYLSLPENEGCGAGLRAAEEAALTRFSQATHWWILDDDAVPPPETLEQLLAALDRAGGFGMAVPLLTDGQGKVWAFPEPVDRGARRVFRQTDAPAEVVRHLGPGPHAACWATGACQLVRVRAARDAGLHRTDFWMLGEDLDFSMRVASSSGLCFVTEVWVPHLPPESAGDPVSAEAWARRKFRSLLQNLTYLAIHQWKEARHLWRYLPGNYRRYFRTYGWSWTRLKEAGTCFWRGAVRGWPAGTKK